MRLLDKLKIKIRGTLDIDRLIKDGLVVGENFHAMEGTIIDPGHCWLIEIGNNVTLAPGVHILAHDASTKIAIGYTRIGRVTIGDNVFIGAGTIILPNVVIASDTIIGAGSVVTKSLDSGVYVGNPCRKVYDYQEYVEKHKTQITKSPHYSEEWTYFKITDKMKKEMKDQLSNEEGYVY